MIEAELKQILNQVKEGELDPDAALEMVRHLPYEDLGFAKLDYHRQLRQRFGEVIYAPSKTPQQCATLVKELLEKTSCPVLLSRPNEEQAKLALLENPGGIAAGAATGKFASEASSQLVYWRPPKARPERIMIITAGTADIPVAEECAAVLQAHGISPHNIYDTGVAGLHRLLDQVGNLLLAELVIVIAGMEGALASVVGGITPAPVIAVPTSVGYGSSLEGITALMSMLATCATGVSVVGIDNALGAAYAALRLINSGNTERGREREGGNE